MAKPESAVRTWPELPARVFNWLGVNTAVKRDLEQLCSLEVLVSIVIKMGSPPSLSLLLSPPFRLPGYHKCSGTEDESGC